jgi:hypothetical protein
MRIYERAMELTSGASNTVAAEEDFGLDFTDIKTPDTGIPNDVPVPHNQLG